MKDEIETSTVDVTATSISDTLDVGYLGGKLSTFHEKDRRLEYSTMNKTVHTLQEKEKALRREDTFLEDHEPQ